jgi:hypothetical protein
MGMKICQSSNTEWLRVNSRVTPISEQATRLTCQYDVSHESAVECERDLKSTTPCNIAKKQNTPSLQLFLSLPVPYSLVAGFLPSAGRFQFLSAQKDLLALHSGYFKAKLAENEQHEIQEVSLPNIDASEFAEFACWLLGYSFMPVNNVVLHADMNILNGRLWQLGAFLRVPGL